MSQTCSQWDCFEFFCLKDYVIIMLWYISPNSSPFLSGTFIMKASWIFLKNLFCIYWDEIWFFVFKSIYMSDYIYWLTMLTYLRISGIKPTWLWRIIFLKYAIIHLISISLRIFSCSTLNCISFHSTLCLCFLVASLRPLLPFALCSVICIFMYFYNFWILFSFSLFFEFLDRVCPYNSTGCSGTCFIDLAALEHTEICLPLPPVYWD